MTKEELEQKIANKVLEAFVTLREYDPTCREIYMSVRKNSQSTYEVRANNDAYKNDCKPLMLIKYITDKNLEFKAADLDPAGFDREETLETFDRAMKEVCRAAQRYGNENQAKITKIALSTMREVFITQMELDGRLRQ